MTHTEHKANCCPKKTCKNNGKCEDCIAAHANNPANPLPYCQRKK